MPPNQALHLTALLRALKSKLVWLLQVGCLPRYSLQAPHPDMLLLPADSYAPNQREGNARDQSVLRYRYRYVL